MPQSMQRAPWSFNSGSTSGSWYSRKSCTRSGIGRFGPITRWIFRKPPISPIARQHLLGGGVLGLLLASAVGTTGGARRAADLARGHRGVLVLACLARLARLVVAVGGRSVRRRLPRTHGSGAVAVAALADHGRFARLL